MDDQDTSGFYKAIEARLLYAPNFVYGPGFSILRESKDQHTYPVDGWSWFESEEEARKALLP